MFKKHALIRRGASTRVTARVGPLLLDRLDRCARLEGRPVILSPREYSVLDYLVRELGRKKLRKKLRKHSKLIETVRGVGYRIDSGNSILPN